jgi:RimJ/RimL family protein N-acetyltransferase
MNWIPHPVTLEGERVRLVPLEQAHFPALMAIGSNPMIWEFMSINGAEEDTLINHLRGAILRRATGEQYPFTVIEKASGNIIGSTLFHNIFPQHRKLEIGWTWYDPAFWRNGYNRECKLLLLTFCFETLNTIRVQLVTDENNLRSRTAILGIGAQFEGMLRNERIRANGAYRNTAMYSIVDTEWPAVKDKLSRQMTRNK